MRKTRGFDGDVKNESLTIIICFSQHWWARWKEIVLSMLEWSSRHASDQLYSSEISNIFPCRSGSIKAFDWTSSQMKNKQSWTSLIIARFSFLQTSICLGIKQGTPRCYHSLYARLCSVLTIDIYVDICQWFTRVPQKLSFYILFILINFSQNVTTPVNKTENIQDVTLTPPIFRYPLLTEAFFSIHYLVNHCHSSYTNIGATTVKFLIESCKR